MQSTNPILTRVETYTDVAEPMTVQGAIQKAFILLTMTTLVGLFIFFYCMTTQNSWVALIALLVGITGGLVFGLILTFKPHTAPKFAVPYALFEGAFLGGISFLFQLKYPGIPAQALFATFVTSFLLLGLYKFEIIRATEKFKAVVVSATLAIFIVFLLQMILRLVFSSTIPHLFESNWLGIGFAAFVAVIASLNLILDFDLIESSAEMRTPKAMEWVCGVAVLATLVWMYTSFLRLLAIISDD